MCSAIAPSPTLAIDAKAKEMRLNGRDVVSFSVGEPDFVTPQYIRTAAHEALDMGLTKYTPAPGTIGLRKAICEKLRWDNGLEYTPAQVIVSNGAKFSIYASLAAIVNPGDEVIIPTPCWVSYPEIVRIVGGVPVLVQGKAERGFVVDAEEIAPYVTEKTKALILNSPNNPNGCVWKREQLEAVCKARSLAAATPSRSMRRKKRFVRRRGAWRSSACARHTTSADGTSSIGSTLSTG